MRAWMYPFPSLHLYLYKQLFARELRLDKDDVVLDAGTGSGHLACALAQKACWLLGVDISREQVELLRDLKTKRSNLQFLCADVASRAFADKYVGRFDKVYSADVMEHLPDPGEFARSLCAVLKNKGRAIVHFPNHEWHGCTHFDEVEEITALFAHLPVSVSVYVAQHTLWGDTVEKMYNLARALYKRAKRIPDTDGMDVNTFEETSYFMSLESTRYARAVFALLVYGLSLTTSVMPPVILQPASGSIKNQSIHIQIDKIRQGRVLQEQV